MTQHMLTVAIASTEAENTACRGLTLGCMQCNTPLRGTDATKGVLWHCCRSKGDKEKDKHKEKDKEKHKEKEKEKEKDKDKDKAHGCA